MRIGVSSILAKKFILNSDKDLKWVKSKKYRHVTKGQIKPKADWRAVDSPKKTYK